MGRTFETLTPAIVDFVAAQHVFFVASAPLAADGHDGLPALAHAEVGS